MKTLPKILTFLCHWCGYNCADLAGTSHIEYPASIRTIEVMCSCMVHPDWVIKALMAGMDGVIILGCHPGECHYGTGNELAAKRSEIISTTLEDLGVEQNRFHIDWVSAAEAQRFAQIISQVTDVIKTLGPNRPIAITFPTMAQPDKNDPRIPFIHVSDRTNYYWDGIIYKDEPSAQKALSRYLDMEMEAKLVPAKHCLLIYTRRIVTLDKQ